MELQKLKLSDVSKSPTNPREDFNKVELASLAEDVKARGLLQPVLVRKKGKGFELIAGERRYRAHELAGLTHIDAVVVEMADKEAEEAQLVENEKRDNLKPLEKAKGYAGIIARHGVSPDELALTLKISRSSLYATLRLNSMCEHAKKALRDGVIPAETAKVIARVHPSRQVEATKEVVGGRFQGDPPLTCRDALLHVQQKYMLNLKQAPFDVKDAELYPEAKACTTCEKRTGAQPDLPFTGAELEQDLCTDKPCWDIKGRLAVAADAEKRGLELLDVKEAAQVFNKFGDLVNAAEYVNGDAAHPGSSTYQKYSELLTPAQKKELMLLAIDPRGHVVELVMVDGLKAAIEETGKLKKRKASPGAKAKPASKARTPEEKAKEEAAIAKAEAEKAFQAKVTPAVIVAMVAAVEKRGLDKATLGLIARRLLVSTDYLLERRKIKGNAYGMDSVATFNKTFGKYTPAQLAGLVFEASIDGAILEAVDGNDTEELFDLAKELGVDLKAVASAIAAADSKPAKPEPKAKPAKKKAA